MAVETSAVQIRIDVTDTNSAAAVASVEGNLGKLGAAGTKSGKKIKEGMDQGAAGALKAKEQIRLAAEEMGVHVPRAMQGIIAKCPAVMGALGAISSVMIGIGAIQIGAMMFEALYNGAKKLYEKWLDVDGAIKRYNDEAGEAASKKFYENAGIDQLNADLREANQQLSELNQKRINSPQANMGPSSTQFATPGIYKIAQHFGFSTPEHFGVRDAHAQNEAQGKKDEADLSLMEKDHQKALQKIDDEKLISEAKVTGIAKARAARDADNKKADEDARYAMEHAKALAEIANRGIDNKRLKPGDKGYRYAVTVSPDTGKTENEDAKAHAAAEFQAQQAEIGREQSRELAHLREQALEAGLHGTALYKAQEAAAINELKFKDMNSMAARNAVHAKFHAEELKRLREQQEETDKMTRTASLAGMTGIQRTQTEGVNRVADIKAQAKKGGLDDPQLQQRIDAANKETNAQIASEQRDFAQEINSIADSSAAHQVQGFARIHADAAKELDALQKKFDEVYGHIDQRTPEGKAAYTAGLTQLHRGQGAIGAGEQGQSNELARRNERETEQFESAARIKSLSAEKQKSAAIGAELDERLLKYKEELDAQEISEGDYNRRVTAAEQMANAERIEAATEARKKMAGEFEGFFRGMEDPKRYLKEMGDKAAGNAAASLFQGFQKRQVGANADQGTSEHAGFFGGILNDFGIGKKKKPEEAAKTAGSHDAHSSAQGMFSVAQATIHIGSASISGGGFGGGSTAAGNASLSVPGSTSLLAPGGSVVSSEAGAPTSAAGASWGSAGVTTGGAGMTNLGTPLPGTSGAGGMVSNASAESAASGTGLSGKVNGAVGNLKQGNKLFMQLKKGFNGAGDSESSDSGIAGGLIGKLNDSDTASKMFGGKVFGSGSFFGGHAQGSAGTSGTTGSSASSAGMAKVGGAAQGVMGVYAASQGGGGAGGAMKGAASGAEAGSIAGPIGAGVGAVVGGVIGAIGSHEPARVYDLKTVRPRLANDKDSYAQGSMDYLSALSDMQSLQSEAFKTMSAMGSNGRHYRDEHITPEIKEAEAHLTAQEKAGRSQYTATGASYATGTPYVPETGLNKNHAGERIFSAVDNQTMVKAVTAGNQGTMPAQTQSMGDVHLHVHAIDAKGVQQFLGQYKNDLRAAVNDSYGENSGGGL